MRKAAWVFLLVIAAAVAALTRTTPAGGQDDAGNAEESRAMYDRRAMLSYEQELGESARTALVRLRARYVVADAACPVPHDVPKMPFYVRLNGPMPPGFSARLQAAGATFVGYVPMDTRIVRAAGDESLARIAKILRESSCVSGTVLPRTEDRMTADAFAALHDGGEFHVHFWPDVSAESASSLLATEGCEVIEADYLPGGRLDMATRGMHVRLTPAAAAVFAGSPLLEMIAVAYPVEHDNVVSVGMVNALPAAIGPGTPYNMTGEGMIVGVWDGGRARDTHVGLQGAYAGGPISNGTKRVLTGAVIASDPAWAFVGLSDTAGISSHATHVTGTVLGDGTGNAAGTGFAPRAYAVSLNSSNVASERRAIRHHFRHRIDTHSYGAQGGSSGGYHSVAATADTDIRDLLMKVTRSAGNEANGGSGDDNTIGDDTCFKNGMIIGAAQDNGDIASFSSRGPSDDGRLMPHFMLNGVGLLSTYSNSDTQYSSISGTSMSTPSAAGSLTLLSELYMREMNNQELWPDLAKALLAATSTDVYNTGPDFRYGYGIPDIQRAADLILANKASGGAHFVRGTVRQGTSMEWKLEVTSSAQPLRVICAWIDIHATVQAAATLVNDLDMELIEPDNTTVHYPYSGTPHLTGTQTYQFTNTGPNRYDNTEYTEVVNPTVGTWTVRVRGHSIPALPQPTVLNDASGFVLVSENAMEPHKVTLDDPLNTAGPVAIPDNNPAGVVRTFNIADPRELLAVRVMLDVKHPARGQLDVYLTHPDNTTVHIETSDTSTLADLIGIFPDTRQYDDDVAVLLGKPAAGTWTVRVTDTVANGTGEIRYLALEVDVDGSNNPPVADAGPDQVVDATELVTLDATQSSDPDNDPLTFSWVQVSGAAVTLSDTASATPTFTAPNPAQQAVLVFEVTVDDGKLGQDTAQVSVTVVPNTPPVAIAGPDITLVEGASASLDGSASFDPDGEPITLQWLEVGSSILLLSDSDSATPSFVAPNVPSATIVTLRLLATDARGAIGVDTVIVTVLDHSEDDPPVADAGPDVWVMHGAQVTLDGTSSFDPEGGPVTFQWSQVTGSPVSLSNPAAANPVFTAPLTDDTMVFQLVVGDQVGHFSTDLVTINVNETGVQPRPTIIDGGKSDADESGCVASSTGTAAVLLAPLLALALRRRRRGA